jgi:argininosuccinate lyase
MSVLKTAKNRSSHEGLYSFTNGIEVDAELCVFEIQVQKAWVRALAGISTIGADDAEKLNTVLDEALNLMQAGMFDWRIEDEDIHMNLERFMTEKLGELGKRVHLGRSRNDLIATTLRLYVADCMGQAQGDLGNLISVLCEKAEITALIIVPGVTHLQHAQPIRFGHILAAHGWALARDKKKLQNAKDWSLESMPLGSAALAGTTLPVDLVSLASGLGFTSISPNSYDSVGDRDFLLDALHACASVALHLSRFAEDLIYWASTPVALVRLPPNWSTGSSIMPNKRNPDVPELIRAKAAHIIAAQTNAAVLLKGIPTSYDSDLHELKSVFQRAFGELRKCVTVLIPFVQELEVKNERAQELLSQGHLLATEVANHLAVKGIPFREAYAQTAALVEVAEGQGIGLGKLSGEVSKRVAPALDANWLRTLSYESAVEARHQTGGTALRTVIEGIAKLKTQNGKI